jgi:hypothetical protein
LADLDLEQRREDLAELRQRRREVKEQRQSDMGALEKVEEDEWLHAKRRVGLVGTLARAAGKEEIAVDAEDFALIAPHYRGLL